jgi:phospholipid/cholesterol/gamma-HCH transport system ATP-binding protein
MQGAILCRGIVNRFGKQVVHENLSLDILPGEVIGIAGGSGSGTSVLLKTRIGLHAPDVGEVLLNGKAIASIGATEKASSIGVLFQQGALFSSLSVAQNIMLPCATYLAAEAGTERGNEAGAVGLPADSGIRSSPPPSPAAWWRRLRAALLDPRSCSKATPRTWIRSPRAASTR